MAARKVEKAPRPAVLPEWIEVEDTLRRVLAMRRDGHSLKRILAHCEITRAEWDRVRLVSRESIHEGDQAVAQAFLARFDEMPAPRTGRAAPTFSPDDGKLLAKDIARWTLPILGPL